MFKENKMVSINKQIKDLEKEKMKCNCLGEET